MSTKTEEIKEETKPKKEKAPKEEKDDSSKKKKTYTVEELLGQGERMELFDEYGKKKKIKVKIQEGKLKKRENRMGYFFIIPYVIGVLLCLAYPLVLSAIYSFHFIRLLPGGGTDFQFKGIQNFTRVFEKNITLSTEMMTLITKLILGVPLIVVLALIIAMMLNMKLKGKGIYRTIFFLPVIIVSGPVMSMITSESTGNGIQAVDTTIIEEALNSALPLWMASSVQWVFENIILLLWYSGVQILIFLAALQKIDTSLYEAAKIDGGSNWECFWKITLPTIRPMLLLNAIYTVVFMSQDSIITPIVVWLRDAITGVEGYGYSAAFAWMYAFVVLIFVGVVALCFMPKPDVYAKQIKKNKKLEKKTRKNLAKHQKQLIKNQVKLQKAIAKEEKMKLAGKDLGGGKYDD
ncbi:sugar ABC transporter permease [Lachnospiraceae bacterium 48-33]|jgi:ABC-type sugar transport systems, permease components